LSEFVRSGSFIYCSIVYLLEMTAFLSCPSIFATSFSVASMASSDSTG
jgi:hypothetical protein